MNFVVSLLAATISVLAQSPGVFAQQTSENTADLPTAGNERPRNQGFESNISVGLTYYYDDNIFATQYGERDDFIALISASFATKSRWIDHSLNAGISVDAASYRGFDTEDYVDYRTFVEGRYDLTESRNLFGGISTSRGHEERSSPNDIDGIEPTEYRLHEVFGGFSSRTEHFGLRLGTTYEAYDYANVSTPTSIVDNRDRSREQTSLGFRLSRPLNETLDVFVQLVRDRRNYELRRDTSGYSRDSVGYRTAFGLTSQTDDHTLEAFIGRLDQSYDDSRFDEIEEPDFGFRLQTLGGRGRVDVEVDRTLEETTLDGSSGYLLTRSSIGYDRTIGPRTTLRATLSRSREEFQNIKRRDDVLGVSAGIAYRLTPELGLRIDAERTERDSSEELSDYSKSRVFFRLVGEHSGREMTPSPVIDGGRGQVDWKASPNGAYLGALLINSHDATGLRGPRGPFGNATFLSTEVGDALVSPGFVAGYRFERGRWTADLEVDVADGGGAWSFTRSPDLRVIDVDTQHSYAIGMNVGYSPWRGARLYTHLGLAQKAIDVDYSFQGSVADRTLDIDGTVLGVGAEVALKRSLALRLDYQYGSFDTYQVDFGLTDDFSHRQHAVRLGLIARLDGHDAHTFPTGDPIEIAGGYWGAKIGTGAIHLEVEGPRGPPANGAFERGDFTGSGPVWDLFGGFGIAEGDWYFGLQADVSADSVDWRFSREPAARKVDIRKRRTISLGPKFGRFLNGSTMLFGQVAQVKSRYSVRYILNNEFEGDELDVDGRRYTIGIQSIRKDGAFWLIDYSHTRYDEFSFGVRRPDRFETTENVFRIGVGFHF